MSGGGGGAFLRGSLDGASFDQRCGLEGNFGRNGGNAGIRIRGGRGFRGRISEFMVVIIFLLGNTQTFDAWKRIVLRSFVSRDRIISARRIDRGGGRFILIGALKSGIVVAVFVTHFRRW